MSLNGFRDFVCDLRQVDAKQTTTLEQGPNSREVLAESILDTTPRCRREDETVRPYGDLALTVLQTCDKVVKEGHLRTLCDNAKDSEQKKEEGTHYSDTRIWNEELSKIQLHTLMLLSQSLNVSNVTWIK